MEELIDHGHADMSSLEIERFGPPVFPGNKRLTAGPVPAITFRRGHLQIAAGVTTASTWENRAHIAKWTVDVNRPPLTMQTTFATMLNGRNRITAGRLHEIAEVLGAQVERLFGSSDDRAQLSDEVR